MTTDLQAFKGSALVNSDMFKRMMELNKTLAGGGGGTSRRISIKGGRFREMVNGDQIRVNSSGSMNVVIVNSSKISRTYFGEAYDPENPAPPTCWSPDSETPSPDVPAENRKASACRDCPMNIKGSGQGDSRACRFSVRLAVCIEGDLTKVYQMQLPATSIFGDAKDGKMGMQAYAKFLTANEMPMIGLVTRMYFDENSETPKLYFAPVRPLEQEEAEQAMAAADSEDAKKAITLTVYKTDKGESAGATASTAYNPKKDAIEIEDAPKKEAAPKVEAKEAPAPEVEVDEPVLQKQATKTDAPAAANIANVLSAWDD